MKVIIEFDVHPATDAILQQVGKPPGTLEVIDGDGLRLAFVESQDAAVQVISELLDDAGLAYTFE